MSITLNSKVPFSGAKKQGQGSLGTESYQRRGEAVSASAATWLTSSSLKRFNEPQLTTDTEPSVTPVTQALLGLVDNACALVVE
jgi:hypothetical protein